MANLPDIDIDFADRTSVLQHITGTPARLNTGKSHNTGVYFTDIPVATDGIATIEHETAEQLGYFKLDLLNVNVYEHVRDELHLIDLMHTEPDWNQLLDKEFCEKIIHIGNHSDLVANMRPVSIARMAMLLAVIRPGKAHLRNKDWHTVGQSVWTRPTDGSYFFKKAHAVSYAHLVVVHMNILTNT